MTPGSKADLGVANPATSLTAAFNNVAGNILFVGCVAAGAGNSITGATYAGAAMTQVAGSPVQIPGNNYLYLFYKLNPATGSNNVVISSSASVYIGATAVSYIGAVGGIDIAGNNTVSAGTSLAKTLITTLDNDWAIAYCGTDSGTANAGASTTLRQVGDVANRGMFDTNGAITPPGSRTLTVTFSSSNAGIIMAAFGGTPSDSGAGLLNFI